MFISVSEQRTTQQGQVYFLHTQTGVSTWHDPRVPRYLLHLRFSQFLDQSFVSVNLMNVASIILVHFVCLTPEEI